MNAEIRTVYWGDPELHTVTLLKLVSEANYPYWEVDSCTGVLGTGEMVNVTLPFSQLQKKNIKGQIVDFARDENIFAKDLGIFSAIQTSV